MKAKFYLIALMIISSQLMIFTSCKKTGVPNQTWHLTGADSVTIVNEVLAATDAFAAASRKMDADEEIQFWDSSQQMMFAENGKQLANRDSIYSSMKGWYTPALDSVEFKWEVRNILPISQKVAHLFGRFYFRAKFKSGEIIVVRPYDTWLLIKKDNSWKIIHGHESYNIKDPK
jgi:ketosteroid isomerase-like protein